jgi:titin
MVGAAEVKINSADVYFGTNGLIQLDATTVQQQVSTAKLIFEGDANIKALQNSTPTGIKNNSSLIRNANPNRFAEIDVHLSETGELAKPGHEGKVKGRGYDWNNPISPLILDGDWWFSDATFHSLDTGFSTGDVEHPSFFVNEGALLPGDVGSVGTVAFSDGFTQTQAGLLMLDVQANAAGATLNDKIATTRTDSEVTLNGFLHLEASTNLAPEIGEEIVLIDNGGSDPVSGTFVAMPAGTQLTLNGHLFELSYLGGDGNDVSLTSISLPPGNQPPDALNDAYVIHQGVTLVPEAGSALLDNDTDPDSDPLTVVAINGQTSAVGQTIQIAGGFLTVEADGNFEFVPTAGFIGVTSFTYAASDGTYSDTATVTINVTNVAPVADDEEYSVLHDQPLYVASGDGLLDGDSDANGDIITISAVNGQPFTFGQAISLGSGASLTVYEDGSFDYMPATGFVGQDYFTYTITDVAATDTATVNIDVTNVAPVADDDAYYVVHDQPLYQSAEYGLLNGDTDLDSDTLTVHAVNGDPEAVGESITLASGATLVVYEDGSFDYLPPAGYVGPDSFTYTITDGADFATATVTIQVTNQAPQASDDLYSVVEGDSLYESALYGLLANDLDPDSDLLTVVAVNGVGFEEGYDYITLTLTSGASLTVYSDGSFDYTPAVGFVGPDSFTYTIFDGVEYSTATVFIDVLDDGM